MLARTTVLNNSANTTNPISFGGATSVYNSLPSQRALWADASNTFQLTGRRIATLGTAVNFTLPPQYNRFRLEWSGVLTNGGPPLYSRFSNDGGASYAGSGTYYYTSVRTTINGISTQNAGNASYLQLSGSGTGTGFGSLEFDPASGQGIWDSVVPTTTGMTSLAGYGQVALGSRLTNIQTGGVSAIVNQGRFRLLGGR